MAAYLSSETEKHNKKKKKKKRLKHKNNLSSIQFQMRKKV